MKRRDGKVFCGGSDVTAAMAASCEVVLDLALRADVQRAYLLRGSPACDPDTGLCGSALRKAGINVRAV